MTVEFYVGDVFDRLAELDDGSVDLIVTSDARRKGGDAK